MIWVILVRGVALTWPGIFAIWAILVNSSFYWKELRSWNSILLGICCICCQRYNVNVTVSICDRWKNNYSFLWSYHPWTGNCKGFREKGGIRPLKIFSKPSFINKFEMPLPTTVIVGLAMLFPSAWWVIEDFSLSLKVKCLLYPLVIGGVGLFCYFK